MTSTSLSLLERLREAPSEEDWRRFLFVYEPLIRRLVAGRQLAAADVDDVTQEVLATLVAEVRSFRHSGNPGAFRTWLRTIVFHRILRLITRRPSAVPIDASQLEDPQSDLARWWDTEHDQHVLQRLLELVKPLYSHSSWMAFEMLAIHGKSAADVARQLGISENAALIAKSRIVRRLRAEAAEWVDS